MKKNCARLLLATSSLALATLAQAGVTTTYTYDALGRLVGVSTTGDVNNGLSTTVAYDPAGNRTSYSTGVGGAPPPPPPAPPPPAPPPPSPPPPPPPSGATMTALNPTVGPVTNASTTVILLTTLVNPNGEPAVLLTFNPPSGDGTATIAADGQSVTYVAPTIPRAPACETYYTVTYLVPYSAQDTSNGATVSGTATIIQRSQNGIMTGC